MLERMSSLVIVSSQMQSGERKCGDESTDGAAAAFPRHRSIALTPGTTRRVDALMQIRRLADYGIGSIKNEAEAIASAPEISVGVVDDPAG